MSIKLLKVSDISNKDVTVVEDETETDETDWHTQFYLVVIVDSFECS